MIGDVFILAGALACGYVVLCVLVDLVVSIASRLRRRGRS